LAQKQPPGVTASLQTTTPQDHNIYTFALTCMDALIQRAHGCAEAVIYSAHPVLHPSGRAFAHSKCSCTLVRTLADSFIH